MVAFLFLHIDTYLFRAAIVPCVYPLLPSSELWQVTAHRAVDTLIRAEHELRNDLNSSTGLVLAISGSDFHPSLAAVRSVYIR